MAFEFGIGDSPVILSGIGGLNLSLDQSDILQDELAVAYNFWYEAGSGRLATRAGFSCETIEPTTFPVELLHSFIRKDEVGYLVGISDSKLYLFDTDTSLWVFVSNLSNNLPCMASFNGNLYIADGDENGLLKWDGENTPARLAGSPRATALHVAGNRLIANSIDDTELDAVYMSGTETDDFDTDTGGGLIIRAGYGDGQRVNCFSSISDTLIISKVAYLGGNVAKKTFYGITMDGDSSGWSADYISKNNAAINSHAMVGFGQDVFYIDTQGFESLSPTQNYGDIATDPEVGGKINKVLSPYTRKASETIKMELIANAASVVIIADGQIFLRSNLTGGFTELNFSTYINHIVNHGDDIYLAGQTGHLYKFSATGTDEVTPGNFSDYKSVIRFKMMSGGGELLLTKSFYDIQYITSGRYKIIGLSGDTSETTILQVVDFLTPTGSEYLYDANSDLYDAEYDLGSFGTTSRLPCRAKYRGNGIAVQITTSMGARISVGKATLMLANVGK